MEPSNHSHDPAPPFAQNAPATMVQSCDLSESLDRLSLANATTTPLPNSPSLLSPHETPMQPSNQLPVPRRSPSSSSLRDERRKSTPSTPSLQKRKSSPNLQKRASNASLRAVSQPHGPPSPHPESSRRPSSNFAGSPTGAASPAMLPPRLAAAPPEPQAPTAASIAAEHFRKEVEHHQLVDPQAKTVVVVHDACYGHRFSRPRASKSMLASIVERPERIRACVVGVSAAYARMGRRHSGESFAPHPNLNLDMLPAPPFRMQKSSRALSIMDEVVTNVHPNAWMMDLHAMCEVAESRLALTGKELVRPRSKENEGIKTTSPELHSGDLYLCSESLNAFQGALGGVCDGIDAVFSPSPATRAFVCIRPPGHHCSADFPSGFCWINNVHVGISYAAKMHGLTHAAILDFDLHHGDGSQDITWAQNSKALTASKNAPAYKKTAIGYYSLHDINSYPCEGGDFDKVRNASVCIDGAHGQSIWNVHLDTWETETEFWKLYRNKYTILINKARDFLRNQTKRLAQTPNGPPPKGAIFLSAGFDASEWEGTGMQRHKVNVPTEFYAKFTADVVRMSQEEGLGTDGRVISVLEGGYSDRALTSGVLSHLAGLSSAVAHTHPTSQDAPIPPSPTTSPVDTLKPTFKPHPAQADYDPEWWSPTLLAELEALVSPPILSSKSTPTFLNSTRSFSAKVVSTPARDRKSFGSYSGIAIDTSLPPMPEVGWATAAHELSKVLIPETRQTTSCRPEDLNAEASRQRRERQVALDGGVNPAIIPPPPPAPPVYRGKATTPCEKSQVTYALFTATCYTSTAGDARRKSATAASMADITSTADAATPSKSTPRSASATGARKTSGGSRSGTPKRSASPRKTAPPVPKVPPSFLPSKLSGEVPQTPTDDVENLTTGLRKIKLVMPSPEEQALREQKAAEERQQSSKSAKTKSPGRTPRKANGSRGARAKATPDSSPPPLPAISMDGVMDTAVKQEQPAPNAGPYSQPLASPFTPEPVPGHGDVPNSTSPFGHQPKPRVFPSHVSPPHTPDNPDLPQQHSSIFSPNTSAAQTRTGLPVFTSSSPIPFAPPETPNNAASQKPGASHQAQGN
ncbi:hypothetical protein N7468_006438 [Penicillium chermesinum]|uniref:Histone deacetylase domain-containing protein n=1 Tax=Penicillium chermesinum TaxID=63820 RepID=A0A9W9TJN9_9EURO|nr:uncharacterized protein N7468_006438 [Penicillium chermesinum]KAJ5225213.1 hypothetical protein N7468_006438 [Penicillium chermesinum]